MLSSLYRYYIYILCRSGFHNRSDELNTHNNVDKAKSGDHKNNLIQGLRDEIVERLYVAEKYNSKYLDSTKSWFLIVTLLRNNTEKQRRESQRPKQKPQPRRPEVQAPTPRNARNQRNPKSGLSQRVKRPKPRGRKAKKPIWAKLNRDSVASADSVDAPSVQ